MTQTIYQILGVDTTADFQQIKTAYYRKAKKCHPDLFGGDLGKAEEFKRLVNAFDILSDPKKHAAYDAENKIHTAGTPSQDVPQWNTVLDTQSDDILEELIVGNTITGQTTLRTLMLDLEKTDRFIRFREALDHHSRGRIPNATALLRLLVRLSPENILYHYYLGDCYRQAGRTRKAQREWRTAIQLGQARIPALRMVRVQRELDRMIRLQGNLLMRWRHSLFKSKQPREELMPDEQMRREVARAMQNLQAEKQNVSRPRIEGKRGS